MLFSLPLPNSPPLSTLKEKKETSLDHRANSRNSEDFDAFLFFFFSLSSFRTFKNSLFVFITISRRYDNLMDKIQIINESEYIFITVYIYLDLITVTLINDTTFAKQGVEKSNSITYIFFFLNRVALKFTLKECENPKQKCNLIAPRA